jgi:hypothetical protein
MTDSGALDLAAVALSMRGLLRQAREHEAGLVALVEALEAATPPAQTVLPPGTAVDERGSAPHPVSMLELVRRACVAAREQRLRVERLLSQLTSEESADDPLTGPRHTILVVDDSCRYARAGLRDA